MATRSSLVLAALAVAPLALGGCWIFMPKETQEAEVGEVAEAPPQKTPAEQFIEQFAAQEQAYAATSEGEFARLEALYVLNNTYVALRARSAELVAEVPVADWEASLSAKLEAERSFHEAAVAAWEGPMPEDAAARPTNNLRIIHGIYVKFLVSKGEPVELVTPHLVTMLTVDRIHDSNDASHDPDLGALGSYEAAYGREATQAGCREAVDALPSKKAQHQRLAVMLGCEWAYYDRWREDLPQWATAKEFKAFTAKFGAELDAAFEQDRQAAIAAAEDRARAAEAREAEWQAEQQAERDANSSSGGSNSSSPASSAPTVVSVTIRNTCMSTVKVFYGKEPKFGSGRQSSLSGNSSQSNQMGVGDTIWLIDDSRNGLASATVSSNTREITVLSSCTGMTTK